MEECYQSNRSKALLNKNEMHSCTISLFEIKMYVAWLAHRCNMQRSRLQGYTLHIGYSCKLWTCTRRSSLSQRMRTKYTWKIQIVSHSSVSPKNTISGKCQTTTAPPLGHMLDDFDSVVVVDDCYFVFVLFCTFAYPGSHLPFAASFILPLLFLSAVLFRQKLPSNNIYSICRLWSARIPLERE